MCTKQGKEIPTIPNPKDKWSGLKEKRDAEIAQKHNHLIKKKTNSWQNWPHKNRN